MKHGGRSASKRLSHVGIAPKKRGLLASQPTDVIAPPGATAGPDSPSKHLGINDASAISRNAGVGELLVSQKCDLAQIQIGIQDQGFCLIEAYIGVHPGRNLAV
jgi:hypothetical protein